MRELSTVAGEATYVVYGRTLFVGGDLAVVLSGGAAHVGAVGVAQPRQRSLEEPPEGALPRGDFAEADPGRALTHRLHGGELEPVTVVVEQARRLLDEQGIRDVSVVMARQGRTSTALTLSVGLREQARLLEMASELPWLGRIPAVHKTCACARHKLSF